MHNIHFVISFSLATAILLWLVLVGIVDPLSVVMVSGILILAFCLYSFLARREFMKLKIKTYSIFDDMNKKLQIVDNPRVRESICYLFERYNLLVKICQSSESDYKALSMELEQVRKELSKLKNLQYDLIYYKRDIENFTKIVNESDKLKSNRHVVANLKRMQQCNRIAHRVISNGRRMRILGCLEDRYQSLRLGINMARIYGM